QKRFRRHQDQRLARIVLHLPSQRVEVLSGRGGIDDLDVSFGAQREEALEPRAGMLRSLSFVTVRQQHRQPAVLSPLLLGAGDKLVDDDLGAVDEVAELRFPDDQRRRIGYRVAILESEYAVFGEQ